MQYAFRKKLLTKKCYKLCNNDTAPTRGEDKGDHAYKFDLIYKVITSNVNNITKHACLDLTGDETAWGHAGYGETGSGITGRIMNKPGISKGGQVVIISDTRRIRPCSYMHRHKLHEDTLDMVRQALELRGGL